MIVSATRGELEQCAEPAVIKKYLGSVYLPAKQFPIVSHAVSGKDDREGSSPSFFNVDEVLQAKSYYVQRLKSEDRHFRTSLSPFSELCFAAYPNLYFPQPMPILGSSHHTMHNAKSCERYYAASQMGSRLDLWRSPKARFVASFCGISALNLFR